MASIPALPISPPVIIKPSQQKVDTGKALKMRLQGQTFAQIATVFDCTPSAIHQALKKFEPFLNGLEPGSLTAYSEHRADLFNTVEAHLTASLLDPDCLAKASLNNRAYAFKQIHEARRLESGQSTQNISVLGKLILQAEEQLGKPAASVQATKATAKAEDGNRVNP